MKNNLPHGKGRITWPDRKYYDGSWHEGNPHGAGKLFVPSSVRCKCLTYEDTKDCKTTADGNVEITGNWINGYHEDIKQVLLPAQTHLEKALENQKISDTVFIPYN